MEIAQTKYDNFKAFIAAEVPNLGWIQSTKLSSTPLELFLSEVHKAYDPAIPMSDITNSVIAGAGFTREQFNDAAIAKFELYIEYFIELSKTVFAQD